MKNDKSYKIHLKTLDIEIDLEGDKDFVENYLKKFTDEFALIRIADRKDINLVKKNLNYPIQTKSFFNKKDEKIINNKENQLDNKNSVEFITNDSEFFNWIKLKKPKNTIETILLIIYWLFENKVKYFSPKDIIFYYEKMGKPKPTNINQYFKYISSKNKHYIESYKRGLYYITEEGKNHILETLIK